MPIFLSRAFRPSAFQKLQLSKFGLAGVRMIIEKEQASGGPERIYIAAVTLKNLHGRKNVEVQLFRTGAQPEEMAALKNQALVGDPPPEMPKELLAGATTENALACLLEAFTEEETEQLTAYLKDRYADQVERLIICPIQIPVPLGVGPLAQIPESESSGFVNFDLAPDYPLPFKFRGFYEIG